MGWWNLRKDTKKLYDPDDESGTLSDSELLCIGDEPMDVIDVALKKVAKLYKSNLKRKPTLDEWIELMESGFRINEEDLFDDIEEREFESLSIQFKQRPKRPKAKRGDCFAIPLPSGGYGYGRIMKIISKYMLWIRILNVRSDNLLSLEELKNASVVIDLKSWNDGIYEMIWPILGNIPFSQEDKAVVANEPFWIVGYPDTHVVEIAEWMLSGKQGYPTIRIAPYVGFVMEIE